MASFQGFSQQCSKDFEHRRGGKTETLYIQLRPAKACTKEAHECEVDSGVSSGHHHRSNMVAYKGWDVGRPVVAQKHPVDLMEEGGALVSAPMGLAHSGGDKVLPRVERRKAESERYASRQDKLGCGSAKLIQGQCSEPCTWALLWDAVTSLWSFQHPPIIARTS